MSTVDIGFNRDEVIAKLKPDLNFLASVFIPEIYEFPFPPLFLAVWQLLIDGAVKTEGQDKITIGLPRGFGKTILLKLFVIWLILFSDRKFIIIVCNTATLAENFLADVMDIMVSSNFIRLFGDYRLGLEKETQQLKKFTFANRPVILAALGAGTSLRGLNIKFVRPDVMIMDDMQSREEAESLVESEKMLTWMLSTLLKANNKKRCQFIFVGNMYPYQGSILKKLKVNPAWHSFICGAILEDGNSIWPELRSVDDILDELENDTSMGKPEIFYSEVMNDEEAGNRAGLDITKIAVFEESDDAFAEEHQAGFVIIDPSGMKKKSDNTAIGAVRIFDGKPVLWDVVNEKLDPKQTIEHAIRLAVKNEISVIIVEAVAYQSTLIYWMQEAIRRYGIHGLRVVEISPGTSSKNARILDALKLLVSPGRNLMLHKSVKSLVTHQIVHFNPLKTNNVDDVLDILAYCYPAITKFSHQLLRPFEVMTENLATHQDDLELSF